MKVEKRISMQKRRRQNRVRNRVRRDAAGRPRLSVFRSNKHIYAQIIDDTDGRTLVTASTMEGSVAGAGKAAGDKDAAAKVGTLVAERATQQGIKQVVFDRGKYQYHGRVAALADAARSGGLEF